MKADKRISPRAFFFFRQFLKSPRSIGSVIPTSRVAVRAVLRAIEWRNMRCIVEYGPGTGVFTRALLAQIGPDSRLIAIDTNADFIAALRSAITDERLILVNGSACEVEKVLSVHGFDHADFVLSGLPFSTIPETVQRAIMDATARAVRPGGAFLVYQYSLYILPMLKARFDRVDLGRVWRCIPPARLFRAWREG